MRRVLRVGMQLTLLVAFANLPAVAQNYLYGTGNPVWGINIPIENGFINVANGNVHMEIPIGNQPQRGSLPLNETVVYDSRIWQIVNSGTSYSFQPVSGGGWTLGGSAYTSGSLQANDPVNETVPCSGSSGSQGYMETTYTWADSSGTAHMFAPGIYSLYAPNCPNGNTGGINNTSTGSAYAVDGSGYYLSVVPYTVNGYTTSAAIVYDQNGNSPTLLEDRNGNYIDLAYTSSSNAWTWTDTLGRKAFVETIANSSTVNLGVITVGGATKPYTLNYETINVSVPDNWQSGVSSYSGPLTVAKSLNLPDGTSYTFHYDVEQGLGNYGEVTEIDLPTGGAIHLTYQDYSDSYRNQNRWLKTYSGGNGSYTLAPQVYQNNYCSDSSSVGCQEQMTVTDGNSNQVVYLLTLNNGAWNSQTDYYNYNSVTNSLAHVLSTTTNYNFRNSCPKSICPGGDQWITASSTTTTLSDTAQATRTQYVYNHPQYGKPDKVQVWDYTTPTGCAGGNTPTKETDYTYGYFVNGAAYVTEADQIDCNGNLTPVGKTIYNYDCTSSTTAQSCSLLATSALPNHSTNFVLTDELGTDITNLGAIGNRGNLTSVVKGTGPTATVSSNYDDAGIKQSDTDANNNQTTYSTMCSDAYLQTVTYPLIVGGKSLQTSSTYDCPSGLITATQDMNKQSTSYSYYTSGANLGRLWTVTRADGGTTTYTYPSSVETDQAVTQSSSVSVTHESILDTYGRSYQSVTVAPEGNISSEITYDATGRPFSVTTPHLQGASSSTDGAANTYYDVLGRTTKVTAPGSSTSASYSGNAQTVTDAFSRSTKYTYDAFHRLASVLEPNSNGTPTYETDYQYNAFDKLIQVDQWGGANGAASPGDRQRLFGYDGLGRLNSVTTPEGGTTTYSYVVNKALCAGDVSLPCSKTDARGVVTQYAYDALNRLTSKSYSNDPSTTQTSCFQYDTSALAGAGGYPLGRLTNQWTQKASAGSCSASILTSGGYSTLRATLVYDKMGHPTNQQQCTPSNCASTPYALSYGYDLAGNLTSYSNGLATTPGAGANPLTFYQSLDSAGRLQAVTSTWSDGQHPSNLFSAQTSQTVHSYAPFGAVTNAIYGNQIKVNRIFNSQLLPTSESDTTSGAATAGSATVGITGAEQYK